MMTKWLRNSKPVLTHFHLPTKVRNIQYQHWKCWKANKWSTAIALTKVLKSKYNFLGMPFRLHATHSFTTMAPMIFYLFAYFYEIHFFYTTFFQPFFSAVPLSWCHGSVIFALWIILMSNVKQFFWLFFFLNFKQGTSSFCMELCDIGKDFFMQCPILLIIYFCTALMQCCLG